MDKPVLLSENPPFLALERRRKADFELFLNSVDLT